jgi:hypothetical protein
VKYTEAPSEFAFGCVAYRDAVLRRRWLRFSWALDTSIELRTPIMTAKFKVGDHVTWNSEAGHVSGKIIKVHTKDTDYKGHTHHASLDDPQYEIKSDETDHIAMHKGKALKTMDV